MIHLNNVFHFHVYFVAGQAPSVVAQKEAVLQPKERLRIRCRLRAGNPIPVLTWYKDGRLVNLTDPRFRLRSKR